MTTEFTKVVLKVPAGASINEMMSEAVHVAVEYNCDVEFTFNDSLWRVRIGDLFACVKNVGLGKENPIKDKKEFN